MPIRLAPNTGPSDARSTPPARMMAGATKPIACASKPSITTDAPSSTRIQAWKRLTGRSSISALRSILDAAFKHAATACRRP